MQIKDIDQHRPIFKLMAGCLPQFVVYVDRIDADRLKFSMGRSIEMTVFHRNRDPRIVEGDRILIDIDSGDIKRLVIES